MNSEAELKADYQVKRASYFQEIRSEMLTFVPVACRRVLDVGCGNGAFGALLKQTRNVEVWGVEPFESAAAQAAAKLDRVICGGFSPAVALPASAFDCVFFNDVLEHLLDPISAIRHARQLLTQDGIVVASIPNIRHFPTLWRLVAHGEWQYRDRGTLDKTHIRFFTRSSIIAMFESAGFALERICGINTYCGLPNVRWRAWRAYRLANLLSLGSIDDMKFQQFAVVARPDPNK